MLPSISEQLVIEYHKAKNIAIEDLAKVHAKIFNLMTPHIDRISAMVVNEIKPLLGEFKKIFPNFRFFVMPITQTFGTDIAPSYQTHINTRWSIFYLNENNQALGIFSLASDNANVHRELYELCDKLNILEESFLELGIALELIIAPNAKHLEIMLNHKRFD